MEGDLGIEFDLRKFHRTFSQRRLNNYPDIEPANMLEGHASTKAVESAKRTWDEDCGQ